MHRCFFALSATASLLVLTVFLLYTDLCRAQGSRRNTALQAGALSVQVETRGNRLAGLSLHDAISDRTIRIDEAFVLVLRDQTRLRSSEMMLTPIADTAPVEDPHRALRHISAKGTATDKSCWSFAEENAGVALQWCIIARAGSGYVRKLLRITTTGADLPFAEVRMLDFRDAVAHVSDSVRARPSARARIRDPE